MHICHKSIYLHVCINLYAENSHLLYITNQWKRPDNKNEFVINIGKYNRDKTRYHATYYWLNVSLQYNHGSSSRTAEPFSSSQMAKDLFPFM